MSNDIFRLEVFKTIEEEVDKYSNDLTDLSLKIHGDCHAVLFYFVVSSYGEPKDRPELKFEERCVLGSYYGFKSSLNA